MLRHLGKTQADDEPLDFATILDSNGLEDTIWCLRALGPEHEEYIRRMMADLLKPITTESLDRLLAIAPFARRDARGAWDAWRAAWDARTAILEDTGGMTTGSAVEIEQERILRRYLTEGT